MTGGIAGSLRGARFFFAVLASALVLAGCARRPPPRAAIAYPYSAAAERVFYATDSGLAETLAAGDDGALPASMAPNASVLSADGKDIAVAVNGWGLERIEASPEGLSYRIVGSPLRPSFSGLSTGGAWPMRGGFLVQLYRDPFVEWVEPMASPTPSAGRLAYFGGEGAQATTPLPFSRDLDPSFELFALLPAKGSWFAELRRDGADRVELKFLALEDPRARPQPGGPAGLEIARAEFEGALRPLPLAGLGGAEGACLRGALALLGPGPWLARTRSGEGLDRWYLSSGAPEEATNVFAWIFAPAGEAMARALAMGADGRLALADGRGKGSVATLAAPAPGASFTALAAAGRILAAAWEEGDFPYVSAAGVVISPLP